MAVEIPGRDYQRESRSSMGNATSAGLGSEAPHDERYIRSVGGQYSDNRPIDIELAEEAKRSEVINRKSNLDGEVPRSPALEVFINGMRYTNLIRLLT